ncbi:hypothetical protein KAZ57_01990 [Patescibacteria group bacterium]|nr:hypothetical protein [Patescibacteria group bacterium]
MHSKGSVSIFVTFAIITFVAVIIGLSFFRPRKSAEVSLDAEIQNPFKTLELLASSIPDSGQVVYFVEGTALYKLPLGTLKPEKIKSFSRDITIHKIAPSSIVVRLDTSKCIKLDPNDFDSGFDCTGVDPQEISDSPYLLYSTDTGNFSPISASMGNASRSIANSTSTYRYYTEPLSSGQANILVDMRDGSVPQIIGKLQEKYIKSGCEGPSCAEMADVRYHPSDFEPSFDGSYLLSSPLSRGGLGGSALIVSRDGSKVYDTGFYWYVSWAVWTGNNTLLLSSIDDAGPHLVELHDDGTFTKTPVANLKGDLEQRELSPNKKHLVLSPGYSSLFVYDLDSQETSYIFEPSQGQTSSFLGWSKDSSKVLYSVHTTISAVEEKVIRVYDASSDKSYDLVKLFPNNTQWNFLID